MTKYDDEDTVSGKEYNSVCERNQDKRKRIQSLEVALKSIARWHDGEPCFCDLIIGDPRVSDHSELCKRTKQLLGY